MYIYIYMCVCVCVCMYILADHLRAVVDAFGPLRTHQRH